MHVNFEGLPCSASDFTWSFDFSYGNCFTFNSGLDANGTHVDLKESIISGYGFGLYLKLYVNVYEELLDLAWRINDLGAVIRIANNSYETLYPFGEGILLSPGFETNIVVDREFRSVLPKPYSNCEIDSNAPKFIQGLDFYNLLMELGYKYTQKDCFVECYQQYVFNKYNCTYYFYPSLKYKKCTRYFSLATVYRNFPFDKNFINSNCLSSCPLECDQSFYKSSLSSSQLTQNNIGLNSFSPNIESDFISRSLDEKSLIQAHIFYDSLSYTLTTELPQWDAITLFGSIGGNLGLFLGVSVFSLCELVEVTVEIFFNLKQRKVRSPA